MDPLKLTFRVQSLLPGAVTPGVNGAPATQGVNVQAQCVAPAGDPVVANAGNGSQLNLQLQKPAARAFTVGDTFTLEIVQDLKA